MANIKNLRLTPVWDDSTSPLISGVTTDIAASGNTHTYIATTKAVTDYISGGVGALWSAGTGTESIVQINTTYPNIASGDYSTAIGFNTTAIGDFGAYAEGRQTVSYGSCSHAEGNRTIASGDFGSHAEGNSTEASGNCSHAEGYYTKASSSGSHAEGGSTIASGDYSHAEGNSTEASGGGSHAEGESTEAIGDNSHAEGYFVNAKGDYSHAGGEGNSTYKVSAYGVASFNHSYQQSTTTQCGAYGDYSAILGGTDNIVEGINSAIIGGEGNSIMPLDENCGIFVGKDNSILNAGGSLNMAIFGGERNTINSLAWNSVILGGYINEIGTGTNFGAIVGGDNNTVNNDNSVVIGGGNNETIAINSAILGGSNNIASGASSVIIGCNNITGTTANTVYVPKLEVAETGEGIIMQSPDGTAYKLTIANGGTLSIVAV